MTTVRDLDQLLKNMSPKLQPEIWVFVTTRDPEAGRRLQQVCRFSEAEGDSYLCTEASARQEGLSYQGTFRQITLEVHSALDAVGFLARITAALADRQIPCNTVSAYHHDHLFVPSPMAELALEILKNMSPTQADQTSATATPASEQTQAGRSAPPTSIKQTAPERAPGLSVASLILGIFSLLGGVLLLLIPPILAVIFGHVSRSQCETRGINAGRSMALAGLIMGYIAMSGIPLFGLLAAMAIPAFNKVRSASQEKAIHQNMAQLRYVADQYCLEHNVTKVRLNEIVGPGKALERLHVVNREKYPDEFIQNTPFVVILADGKELPER